MKVMTKVIALEPTTVCTLRCRLCALGIPYLKAPKHDSLETIRNELSRLFSIWDYAERVDIAGGEPLCHPQLVDVVRNVLDYKEHYESVRIVTNCTIMPSEALWSVIEKNKDIVGFLLDDYGKYSPHFAKIKDECAKRGVNCKTNTYHGNDQYCGGWIDFGGWENRHYSTEELLRVYNCCHTSTNPCITVYGGAAYFCCRSMLGYLLGHYEINDTERIDLLDTSIDLETLRTTAINFGTYPPVGCRYCDGFDVNGQRYPAAEQI